MFAEPQAEHRWLEQLVGEWTSEVEPSEHSPTPLYGKETVRSLGGLWIVANGEGEMPGGGKANMVLTVGFDPQKKRFVGTWFGSMMTNLWVYDGELDADQKTLTLHTEGPNFEVEGTTAKYKEVITIVNKDERTFWSYMQKPDGQWHNMMKARYRRAK